MPMFSQTSLVAHKFCFLFVQWRHPYVQDHLYGLGISTQSQRLWCTMQKLLCVHSKNRLANWPQIAWFPLNANRCSAFLVVIAGYFEHAIQPLSMWSQIDRYNALHCIKRFVNIFSTHKRRPLVLSQHTLKRFLLFNEMLYDEVAGCFCN